MPIINYVEYQGVTWEEYIGDDEEMIDDVFDTQYASWSIDDENKKKDAEYMFQFLGGKIAESLDNDIF